MTLPLDAAGIQAWLEQSPFMAFARLRCVSADPDAGRIEMVAPMRPEFERMAGSNQWHGGPIAAVIDTAGDFALVMAVGQPLPTINFRVDYLRPAIGTDLLAVATVRRQGRTVGVVDVEVFNDARVLVAIGRATYAI